MDDALIAVVHQSVGLDVAFVQQNLSNGLLQVGSRNIDSFVLCRVSIPNTGQHICYGVSDVHINILLNEVTGFTREDQGVSGECAGPKSSHLPGTSLIFVTNFDYQLALRTPGI